MTPLLRHHSIIFLIMRRLRAPLILLISILAVSVLGLTLAPGVDDEGKVHYLSFFHALYFMSYTATTIGFGEIPYAFSDQQRLWVTLCIYLSVIGWAYSVGTVFALLADRSLQLAIRTHRFLRAVKRLREPFYLVCGYGETGRLICSALDQLGYRAVVVECDEVKAGEIDLHSYRADVPTMCADARNPDLLQFAGLTHPYCIGVIALTNDDSANLAIAIAARLLAPKIPALCRAETPETAANMASFGTRYIINPFEKFAEYLSLALHAPAAWHLLTWLTGLPGTTVERERDPPPGGWIVCGHGRFGRVLVQAMEQESAVSITIIDREPSDDPHHRWVQGDGTGAAALEQAGVREAAGIIAGTGNDVDNLSIAVTARELNPALFVILRQNHYANHSLFEAYDSDVDVVPSEIIAHECLAILTTPLLVPFLNEVKRRDEPWCAALLDRLTGRFGWQVPSVWSERISFTQAPALHHKLMHGATIALREILRAPSNRDDELACEVLYLHRDDDDHFLLPDPDTEIRAGDELLLVGRQEARHEFDLTLSNEHALTYVLSGRDLPGGWLWEKFSRDPVASPAPHER
ncbi:potassium channel family protein [Aromatoleum bremense]|uniref:Potassium channel protein n=1 Tax=Aromatoleum bremense TaxID=76115 RepID=A0ABX1NSN2_9RHOO|nr:NAD-binding protein [Aromatoleum bremense]NMG14707.1 potassium channel protein [Aromatoleum bremense]QTQ30443.1 Potassium channel [Aromatoleum bremense]